MRVPEPELVWRERWILLERVHWHEQMTFEARVACGFGHFEFAFSPGDLLARRLQIACLRRVRREPTILR